MLPMQGLQVQSLVGELKSHMMWGIAKKREKERKGRGNTDRRGKASISIVYHDGYALPGTEHITRSWQKGQAAGESLFPGDTLSFLFTLPGIFMQVGM